jgi:hypothetical protein
MSREILAYLLALDVKEIHGYRPEFGLRIFREPVQALQARAREAHGPEEDGAGRARDGGASRAKPTTPPPPGLRSGIGRPGERTH